MDNIIAMTVFHGRDDLLEEGASLIFRHLSSIGVSLRCEYRSQEEMKPDLARLDNIIEELALEVFYDHDNTFRCLCDIVSGKAQVSEAKHSELKRKKQQTA